MADGSMAPPGAPLPDKSIRYLMKRSIGGDRSVLTDESVAAVQRCTSEYVSFIVSEARAKVWREGKSNITYADIMAVLQSLGFK